MKTFKEIIARAAQIGPKKVAVAGLPHEELQEALQKAKALNIAVSEAFEDAARAVASVRSGECDMLIKGTIDTKAFMKAILDKENGLCTGRLISHIAIFEAMGRLLLVTDGGICIQPSLEDKVEILKNAVKIAHGLGIETPNVAVLAAIEKVNSKMPETVDAEKLSRMDIPGCRIQGPLAVDNAISVDAAKMKGIEGPVAGQADILLVPSVLVGNIFAKGIMYFGHCAFGGIVAGTSKPAAFLSRSDSIPTRINTLALTSVLSEQMN